MNEIFILPMLVIVFLSVSSFIFFIYSLKQKDKMISFVLFMVFSAMIILEYMFYTIAINTELIV